MNARKQNLKNILNRPKQLEEILEEQLESALIQHKRSNYHLFLSAISAGLEVGFSFFLMAALFISALRYIMQLLAGTPTIRLSTVAD